MSKPTAKQKYWSEQLLLAESFEGSLTQYVSVRPSTSNNSILNPPSSVFSTKGKHNVHAHCKTEILV
jgi:hypothetical protein